MRSLPTEISTRKVIPLRRKIRGCISFGDCLGQLVRFLAIGDSAGKKGVVLQSHVLKGHSQGAVPHNRGKVNLDPVFCIRLFPFDIGPVYLHGSHYLYRVP